MERVINSNTNQALEQENLLKIYDSLPVLCATICPSSGKILACNSSFSKLLLYENSEVIGKSLSYFFHPNDLDVALGVGNGIDTNKNLPAMEVGLLTKKGTTIPVLFSVDLQYNKEGALQFINTTFQNNTAIKGIEKKLEDILTLTSHDLRSPLNSIGGLVNLLLRINGQHYDQRTISAMQIINQSILKMTDLVDGLPLLASNKERKVKKLICPENIVAEVLEQLDEEMTNTKGSVDVEGELPLVKVYKEEFKEAFCHLISNALSYHKIEEPPHVKISADRIGEQAIFKISDNGIGIEEKDFKKIFMIFRRVHNERNIQGLGLGLNKTKKIIENHAGKIWVESKIGVGSDFFFSIPLEN